MLGKMLGKVVAVVPCWRPTVTLCRFSVRTLMPSAILSVIAAVRSGPARLHPHGLAIVIMVTVLCLAALGGAVMKLLTDDLPAPLLA